MKDEALKLALEALQAARDGSQRNPIEPAITAIRAALTAPVQEPVSVYRLTKLVDGVWTPATEWNTGYPDPDWEELEKTDGLWKIQRRVTGQQIADGLAKAFAAQPAPVQEPVAWIFKLNRELLWPHEVERKNPIELNEYVPLYTNPLAAQRQWVGLADEEIEECWDGYLSDYQLQMIREMEAKLKEKNV